MNIADVSSGEDSDDEQNAVITRDTTASNFLLRLQRANDRTTKILFTGNPDFTEREIFMKFFPKSLILRIVECTNERLQILSEIRSKK